jgi:uncharacterized protein
MSPSTGKGNRHPMERSQVLLAILAAAQGRPFTPAQIQKAAFLVTRNLPGLVTRGQNYNFVPYDYGPFDQSVYADAEMMVSRGALIIAPSPFGRWSQYSASDLGVNVGNTILDHMDAQSREYVISVVQWVRSLSFQQLVKAIYDRYPEMRENSVFRG